MNRIGKPVLAAMLAVAITALADEPRVIATRAELAAIASDLTGSYVLGADIDLSGSPWKPLGENNFHMFTGSFDGNGHVISNLTVTGNSNYAGLFGYLGSGATVTNLRLANATVSGKDYVGALAGRAEGATVADCSVVGATVTSSNQHVGGFIGSVVNGCSVSRCFAIADISAGSNYGGGFIGSIDANKASCAVSACFSAGSVSSTRTCVGGFIGYVAYSGGSGLAVSDCYTVAGVHGSDKVGGFIGSIQNACSVTRCYAAGGDTTGNSNVGGFVGFVQSSYTSFTDCFRLVDGHADVGTEDLAGIVALDAAEMRSTNKFTAFQAAGCWTQVDGLTQPYFDWGLVDGRFLLLAGDAATVTGLGAYAPGTDVPISIDPTDGIFLGWTGGASYANASTNETTVLLDNYHVVSADLGTTLIKTRAQLAAISSNLSGSYGLGADIDLSGSPWTPIGSPGSPFTGKLYGRGYKITGLAFDNTSSGDSAGTQVGLFRRIDGATIDGVHLEGVSIKGYERCGALAGEVRGASKIRNCSAQGSVSGAYSYIGLLAGYIDGSGVLFEGCATTGSVSAAGSDAGGFVGYARGCATFTDCHACAEVSGAGHSDSRGGFISAIFNSGSFAFSRCTAEGTVSAFSNEKNLGGFIAYVGRPASFTDCSANVSVSGRQSQNQKTRMGGFAGYIGYRSSDRPSFLRCTAEGDVSSTGECIGGFAGFSENDVSFTDCRADGHVGGNGSVGGFIGYVSTPMAISNCVARGDVRSTGDNYGGFVGYLANADAVVADCWCSGAVWGTGGNIGSFVGKKANGTIRNCSVDVYGAGPRPFCGSDASMTGGSLTGHQVEALSKDGNGTPWPEVKQRFHGATTIRTADELRTVMNDLAGIYVLDRDIDLGGAAWTPIGDASAGFTGEFYGQNHRIFNFTVDTMDRYAGFFGRIAGGRVSGVALEGTVTGAPDTSDIDVGVGGFAGKIDSKSLVEDCSFKGAVTNSTTYSAGGFVGYVDDSPVILRSCVLRATVANTSSQMFAGGFVAWLNGGYVMDCYAVANVEADSSYVGGFAGFVNGSITNAWCAGSVTVSGSSHGAFAGDSDPGKITKSYYDYDKTSLGAVNNTPFTGITGRSSQQMLHAASFAFDFDRTWQIKEGETTPYLRTTPLAPFADGDITLTPYEAEYDGAAHTIGVSVTNAIPWVTLRYCGVGVGEPSAFNFELSTPPFYTDVTNVTVYVEASAPGYYPATNSAALAILPRSIADATIAPIPAQYYEGAPLSPAVSVQIGGLRPAEGTDYTASYAANDAPGTATVTLTGKGNYTGRKQATFQIIAANRPLTVKAGKWGRVAVVVDGATNWIATGTAEVPVGYGSSVTVAAVPDAGFAADGPAGDLSFASYTESTNLVFSFVPTPAATIRWKFSSAVGRYFAQVAIPAHAGYDEALGGLAFLFADRAKKGTVYAQLWDVSTRAPKGVLVTNGGVAYRGATLGSSAFSGKGGGTRVIFGVSNATFAETRDIVPTGERQIGLYVRKRVDPVSGNEAAAEVESFLGYLTWTTGGVRHYLPVVADWSSSGSGGSSGQASSHSNSNSALGTYKVAFKANGGTGTMAAQAVARGKAAKLRKNAFTRKGFVFLGWATKNGGAVKYKDQASVKNLAAAGKTATLYAVWAKPTYKVAFNRTYKDVRGKMKKQSFTYGKGKRLRKNTFKRPGYKFKGWAKSKALAKKGKVAYANRKKVKNLTKTGKTVTLYAVWAKEH